MRYFEIHVVYDDESGEGYSIFVIAENKDTAVRTARDKKMFASEFDFEDIDYICEIDKEEYDRATA